MTTRRSRAPTACCSWSRAPSSRPGAGIARSCISCSRPCATSRPSFRSSGWRWTTDAPRASSSGLRAHLEEHDPERVRLLSPHSIAGVERLGALDRVEIVERALFLTDPDEFGEWVGDRKKLRMEDFYRWQRRRLDVLMDGDDPVGGRWNFDSDNREPPPRDERPPAPYRPREDQHRRAGARRPRPDGPGHLRRRRAAAVAGHARAGTPVAAAFRRASGCPTSAAGRTRCSPASS